MNRLTLQPRRWYAMDLRFATENQFHFSPIWIVGMTPHKTGTAELTLEFCHANYPDGVQIKSYTLRVLRRTSGFLLAEVVTAGEPHPVVIITEITTQWLQHHWPDLRTEGDIQLWCDNEFGRPGHFGRPN